MENQKKDLIEKIKVNVEKLFGLNSFHTIMTEEDLNSKGPVLKSLPTGAVLLDMKFARGTNIRFMYDSEVYILGNAVGNETSLKWPIVT